MAYYLLNIYIDSILSRCPSFNNGCILGINKVNIQAYADDIVRLPPTRQRLQFLIDQIAIDFNAHCLEVNTKKTVFMVFSNTKKTNDKILRVHFTYSQLKRVFNCRYLGIILNFNLCDSLDMARATGAFNRSFEFLFRKFN